MLNTDCKLTVCGDEKLERVTTSEREFSESVATTSIMVSALSLVNHFVYQCERTQKQVLKPIGKHEGQPPTLTVSNAVFCVRVSYGSQCKQYFFH